jgi:hypothetical protein
MLSAFSPAPSAAEAEKPAGPAQGKRRG